MIQESTMHKVVAVGVDTSDQMVFDCGQTRTSTDGVVHVIRNEGMKLIATNIGGNASEFELDDSFLSGCNGINDGFYNRANHNFYEDLGVSWDLKGCEDIEIALKKISLSSISASWECDQLDPFITLFAVCGLSSPYPRELHEWSYVWKFMIRDLIFDRKKGHSIKISWCSFANLFNDEIYLLKLWIVTRCLEVVGVFNVQDALEYWVSGRFPLMKMSTIRTPCGKGVLKEGGNIRNPHLSIECI